MVNVVDGQKKKFVLLVVSVVISGLIVRIVAAIYDSVKDLSNDVLNDECKRGQKRYKNSKSSILSTIMVLSIYSFVAISIYKWYTSRYDATL